MKIKDKNRPKSPLTSFACFVQVIREKHSSLHPNDDVIFSEFAKKCAEKWRQMPAKEREPFDEMCRLDIKRYNREMGEYIQPEGLHLMHHQQQQQQQQHGNHSETGHRYHRGTKRRRIKDPSMPKRSWSAFFFFCDEVRPRIREAHPEWKVSEIAKELGKRWEECRDKTAYEVSAQSDKLRYEEDMRKYKAGSYVMVPKRNKDLAAAMLRPEPLGGSRVISGFEIEGSREVDEVECKPTLGNDEEDEEDDDDEEEEEEEDDDNEEDKGLVVDGDEDMDLAGGSQQHNQEEEDEVDDDDDDENDDEDSLKGEAEEAIRRPTNSFSVAFVSGNHKEMTEE